MSSAGRYFGFALWLPLVVD